jgi:hypothetical protein
MKLTITALSAFLLLSGFQAQAADECKACRDQQKACSANYSGKTCKVEYDLCMKSCRKK